jgi:hypothetical protein
MWSGQPQPDSRPSSGRDAPCLVEAFELVELPGLVEPRFQRAAVPFELIEWAPTLCWRCVTPNHLAPRPLGRGKAWEGVG